MFEPLRITAYLQTGVICEPYLPLDGILYYISGRALGERGATASKAALVDTSSEALELPLQKADTAGDWYYRCSFAEWPDRVAEYQDHWVKRFDQSMVWLLRSDKRITVPLGSGRYKAYRMPLFARHALHVRWYAVGDKARIEALLEHATYIGKKTSQGWGAVLRWQVERWGDDWSIERDGKLMRAVPKAGGRLHGIRPSYWLRENQFECELPDVR